MSLLGFKAKNHPQQTAIRGALDEVDDRGTKWEFIHALEARLGGAFTLDVAAAKHNAKAERFYTRADDGLRQPWSGRVWCNPPYSRIAGVMDLGSWVRKAWDEWHRNRGLSGSMQVAMGDAPPSPELIAMLVPANRCEQAWWQEWVEPLRDRPDSELTVEFLPKRMRFDMPPEWETPEKGDRPPFGLALLVWGGPRNLSSPPGEVQP
jgi:hypothetical protein